MAILRNLLPLLVLSSFLAACGSRTQGEDSDSVESHPAKTPPERSAMFPCTEEIRLEHFPDDTTHLRSGGRLFHEGDCDSVRLILELEGERHVVSHFDPDALPYHYRLGHHLVEEFDSSLLFRWGCPASSECPYALHHSRTGELIADLPILLGSFGAGDRAFLLYIDTVRTDGGRYDTLAFYRLSDHRVYRVRSTPGFSDNVRHLWGVYAIDSIAVEGDSVIMMIGWVTGDSLVKERRVVGVPFVQ